MTQIFISYSRKDLKFVEGLASDLKRAGFEVWYDFLRLRGGERWRIEIQNALKASQCVITVLSPDSVASEWVEREFLFASSLKRGIIPLLLRDCELPLNYMDLNYIDVRGENYPRNFGKILEVLNESTGSHPRYRRAGTQVSPVNEGPRTMRGDFLRLWMPGLILLSCLALSAGMLWVWAGQTLKSSDRDQDTLTYAEERAYGCDPDRADSDGDGLADPQERDWKTYCTQSDSDRDELSDGEEVQVRKTNPGNGDTDGDYWWDGDEVFNRNTDPTLRDTDGDGIIDSQDPAPREASPLTAPPTDPPATEPGPPVPPPIANPAADAAGGMAPLTVNFSGSRSEGSYTTFAWNFGDNGTSSEISPAYTFPRAGIYGSQLTVSGPGGDDQATVPIVVAPPSSEPITLSVWLTGSDFDDFNVKTEEWTDTFPPGSKAYFLDKTDLLIPYIKGETPFAAGDPDVLYLSPETMLRLDDLYFQGYTVYNYASGDQPPVLAIFAFAHLTPLLDEYAVSYPVDRTRFAQRDAVVYGIPYKDGYLVPVPSEANRSKLIQAFFFSMWLHVTQPES